MRTIEFNIFNFDELSEKAKETAREKFRTSNFLFPDDFLNTVEKIGDAINCEVNYHSYDGINYFVNFILNDNFDLQGKRAFAYIENNYIIPNSKPKIYRKNKITKKSKIFFGYDNCPFTGYYADCAFFESWNDWKNNFTNKSTVEDFLNILGDKLGKWWSEDNEYQLSDENIDEFIIINNYEFYENGKLYH